MRKLLTNSDFIKIPLHLPEIEVLSQKLKRDSITVSVESRFDFAKCPTCSVVSTKRLKDDKIRLVRDLNALQWKVFLQVKQRRFLCLICHRRFRERFEFLAEKARLTKRMQAFLLKQSCSQSLLKTARNNQVGYRQTAYLCFAKGTQILRGKQHARLPKHIGIDEFALRRGHRYATVICNNEKAEICGIGENRTAQTVTDLFGTDQHRLKKVRQVVMDCWQPFHKAVREVLPKARRVIDRFHIERYFIKAIDKCRKRLAKEHKSLAKTLKKCRSLLVKTNADLTVEEQLSCSELFQQLPELKRAVRIFRALRRWYQTKKEHSAAVAKLKILLRILKNSAIKELVELAKMLESWQEEIANYFLSYSTNGRSEGINTKIKLIKRTGFGRLTFAHLQARIFLGFLHPT